MNLAKIDEKYRVILASASPRRREILTQAGLSFEVIPSKKDEMVTQTKPERVVMELSAQQAEDVFMVHMIPAAGAERKSHAVQPPEGLVFLIIAGDAL